MDEFDNQISIKKISFYLKTENTSFCTNSTIFYFSGDDIANQCTVANPSNTCAQQTCSCEVQFVSQLMGILFSFGNGYTQNFNHNSGFSVDQTCKIWISGEKNWECCGTAAI